MSPAITSVEDHYVIDIDLHDPVVEAAGWRLSVSGLVERPLELDLAEMQSRFAVVEEVSVLTCISNEVGGELAAGSAWSGVRLADVLRSAKTRPGATDVVFGCADGYDVSIALGRALERLDAVGDPVDPGPARRRPRALPGDRRHRSPAGRPASATRIQTGPPAFTPWTSRCGADAHVASCVVSLRSADRSAEARRSRSSGPRCGSPGS